MRNIHAYHHSELCDEDIENLDHFLLKCKVLHAPRLQHLSKINDILEDHIDTSFDSLDRVREYRRSCRSRPPKFHKVRYFSVLSQSDCQTREKVRCGALGSSWIIIELVPDLSLPCFLAP